MKLSLGAFGATSVVVLALYACADSESSSNPNDGPDGSSLPPTTDSGVIDPPADAAGDADVVTPARTCSDSNICHLALPVKENLVSVWADGAGIVWAVSTEGTVLRLDSSGWKVHATGLGALVAIWGSGPTDIWAAGEKGIYQSTGAAFNASTLPGAFPTKITSLFGTAANDVWATGDTTNDLDEPINVVLHFDGTSWKTVTVPKGNTYYRVWGHPGSGVWLAGSHLLPPPDDFISETTVVRRAPGASSFTEVTLPKDTQFPDDTNLWRLREVRSASAPTGTTVWLQSVTVASFPGLMRGTSTDNGQTFTWTYDDKGLTSTPEYNAVATADAVDGWAAGEWGQIRRWDGTKWQPQAVTVTKLPVINELNAIWATKDHVYFVGDQIALDWRKP